MENWIEKPAEPLRLYLAWQAPDNLNDRYRWAVGILEPQSAGISLQYLAPGGDFELLNAGAHTNAFSVWDFRDIRDLILSMIDLRLAKAWQKH